MGLCFAQWQLATKGVWRGAGRQHHVVCPAGLSLPWSSIESSPARFVCNVAIALACTVAAWRALHAGYMASSAPSQLATL